MGCVKNRRWRWPFRKLAAENRAGSHVKRRLDQKLEINIMSFLVIFAMTEVIISARILALETKFGTQLENKAPANQGKQIEKTSATNAENYGNSTSCFRNSTFRLFVLLLGKGR